MHTGKRALTLLLAALLLLSACAGVPAGEKGRVRADAEVLYREASANAGGTRTGRDVYGISSPGTCLEENEKAAADYSNACDGYVTVRAAETGKRFRLQLSKDGKTYSYYLKPGEWEVFPLTEGSGSYKISVFENIQDDKYALVLSTTFPVEIPDEFAPFLLPNQYVNYMDSPVVAALASLLERDSETGLDKIGAVYDFVLDRMTYDKELAASVPVDYVPDLEASLASGKGICFDYAALMAALLRLMGQPCKLVTGYAASAYHAWISVWTEETGWLDAVIFFDGEGWQRTDPTFADAGLSKKELAEYIGDGASYVEKYWY